MIISQGQLGEEFPPVHIKGAIRVVEGDHTLVTEDELPLGPVTFACNLWDALAEKSAGRSSYNYIQID